MIASIHDSFSTRLLPVFVSISPFSAQQNGNNDFSVINKRRRRGEEGENLKSEETKK